MKKYFRLILFFVFLALSTGTAFASTPTVLTESKNSSSIGKYQKFESTFTISKSFPAGSFLPYYYYDPSDTPLAFPGRNSPYGVDGITVDAHFRSPSGKDLAAPAFYFQDYARSGDTMTPSNNFMWKVRFAPEEIGNYTYYLTIQDKEGTTRYPSGTATLNFQSVASSSKGFIRVSPRDSRFFEFDNGESFIPNSSGRQWWRNGKRTTYYESSFAEFKQYGINFTRIWDQNDSFGLTVEGHFDGYKYPDDFKPTDAQAMALPKGTQMNQRGNYEEDVILQSAEQNGVYIELSSHGDPYWIWDASVYNEGWNPSPKTFNDPQHVNYWKRNYRYRVARWGYSTSVLAWEVWNEHGHIPANSDLWNFYVNLEAFIKNTDPYRHLRTTSMGSQTWSPAFWSSAATGMDIGNFHNYMMGFMPDDLYHDAANFVYRNAQCLRTTNGSTCNLGLGDGGSWSGSQKPFIWGELDTGTSNWNEFNPQPKATHDMRWAGLFSPLGTTGVDWYYDQQSANFIATKHADAKIASDFFKTIDYAGKNFSYLSSNDVRLTSTVITPSNANLRVLAMKSANNKEAYAWVQNKANSRWDQPVNTTPLTATFTIPGMAAGSYTVEMWDTYTGQKSSGGTVTASNGNVTTQVNNLSKDVAIKIISTSNSTPTATPTGTSPSVTPTPCKGDINGDSVVDLSDYSLLVQNFLKSPLTNVKADLSGDGIVDLTDYSILVGRFLKPCSP